MIFEKLDGDIPEKRITEEYREAVDIFPALHKYQAEHNIENLQKLCVELSEFCSAVYASTRSPEEREIYRAFVSKLNK